MNVLLLSMPDSFEHTPTLAMRMPNGALASLAGNVDPHHHVAIADLILVQRRCARRSSGWCASRPDVVGLSIMTFQRRTARRIIALIRSIHPGARSSSAATTPASRPDVYEDPAWAWTSSSAVKATSRSGSWCARSSRTR